ncbi:integrase, catalytic region, zinc finger, CCHC-type containing protein [Tanacetum coccineum]
MLMMVGLLLRKEMDFNTDSENLMLRKRVSKTFRLQTSHPNTDQSASSPVKIEAPWELPKGMYKIDPITLAPKDKNNRETHIYYLKHTMEQAAFLREMDEQAKSLNPLDNAYYSACTYFKLIQELLGYVRDTCPDIYKPSEKLVDVTPINKKKIVSKPKIAKSMISNKTEPDTSRGSNTLVAPSSSSSVDLSSITTRLQRLWGSRETNLYTLSIRDMMASSPICLLSKASKTKSWLWHRRLSHLNFGAINHLAKNGLVRGLPKLKFEKDHLCLACAMGKSKKQSHKSKSEDTNEEKLYLFHMDLCGPMRIASINGKKYILVIMDDYSHRDLGKLNAKADIGIFVGYAPAKKAFRVYNSRTRKIMETIHVTFDELIALASEQFGLGHGLQSMTPTTSCSGLVPNIIPQQPCNPPNRDDWDSLFQPLFDEYFNPPTIVVSPVPVVAAPRAVYKADSPMSTSIDQDAPSTKSPKTPVFHDDPLHEFLHEDSTSQGSSSNVRPSHIPFELIGRWTKDHSIENVISDPSRSVSTRKQLETEAM